jgi:DNA-directed RNA polymerase subunit RPC12/RpoP
MMCKKCFLKHRPKTVAKIERDGVPLRVEEWECVKCGAPLEPEEVDMIKRSQTIECDYCGSTLTMELFT